jgi:hypothetical protein
MVPRSTILTDYESISTLDSPGDSRIRLIAGLAIKFLILSSVPTGLDSIVPLIIILSVFYVIV